MFKLPLFLRHATSGVLGSLGSLGSLSAPVLPAWQTAIDDVSGRYWVVSPARLLSRRLVAGVIRLCAVGGPSQLPGAPDPPPVAMYLALFVAFALTMLGAAWVISQNLPAFFLEF